MQQFCSNWTNFNWYFALKGFTWEQENNGVWGTWYVISMNWTYYSGMPRYNPDFHTMALLDIFNWCLVANLKMLVLTIISDQSVISSVYTSCFGSGMPGLEPHLSKSCYVQNTVEKPPKVSCTKPNWAELSRSIQWKSSYLLVKSWRLEYCFRFQGATRLNWEDIRFGPLFSPVTHWSDF